jgi:hypothetical protein
MRITNLIYKNKTILVFSIILLASLSHFAFVKPSTTAQEATESKNEKTANIQSSPQIISPSVILLPINAMKEKGDRTNLKVLIPENFRAVQDPRSPIIEFIPSNEQYDTWSEIITTHTIVGQKVEASVLISNLRLMITMVDSNARVIQETAKKNNGDTCATLVISYTHNNRKEVLCAQYCSGPADCSGFQYTIASNNSEKEDLEKIANFVMSNTSILKF